MGRSPWAIKRTPSALEEGAVGSSAQYPDLESSSVRAFQGFPRGDRPHVVLLTVAGLCRLCTGFLRRDPTYGGAGRALVDKTLADPKAPVKRGTIATKQEKRNTPFVSPRGGNVLRASPGAPFSERRPPPWGVFVSGLQKKRKLPPPLSAPPPGIPSRLLHCFCPVLLGFLPSRAAGIPEGQRDRRDGVSLGPAFLKKAIHSKRGQGPCRSRKSVN